MTARQDRDNPAPAPSSARNGIATAPGSVLRRDMRRRFRIATAVTVVLVCPILAAIVQGVWSFYWDHRALQCASGSPGGDFDRFTRDLKKIISTEAGERQISWLPIPETTLSIQSKSSAGTYDNLALLRAGSVTLGFAQEGFDALDPDDEPEAANTGRNAGTAETRTPPTGLSNNGSPPAKDKDPLDIQTLAVVGRSVFQVVARRTLGLTKVSDLHRYCGRHLPVFIGSKGSGTRSLALAVLGHHGLSEGDFDCVPDEKGSMGSGEAVRRLALTPRSRESIDVAFFLVSYGAPALERLDQQKGKQFCLLDVDRAAGVQAAYPALEPVTIPAGTYSSLQPASIKAGARTLASRAVLLCNKQLSRHDAYTIVQALYEDPNIPLSASAIAALHALPRPAERSYFPIHPGARAYFRGDDKPAPVDPALLHAAYPALVALPAPILWLLGWRRLSELAESVHAVERDMEALNRPARDPGYAAGTVEPPPTSKEYHPAEGCGREGGSATLRADNGVAESEEIARLRRKVEDLEFQAARLYWQRKIKSDVYGALSAYTACLRREIDEAKGDGSVLDGVSPGNGVRAAP
jgi:TRAP transporter TAXI family solute receptor